MFAELDSWGLFEEKALIAKGREEEERGPGKDTLGPIPAQPKLYEAEVMLYIAMYIL